jgi:hypothetical protein
MTSTVKLMSVNEQFKKLNSEMFERLLEKNPYLVPISEFMNPMIGWFLMEAQRIFLILFHDTVAANGELPCFCSERFSI